MVKLNLIKNFISQHKKFSVYLALLFSLFLFLYYFLIQPSLFLYAESKTIKLRLRPIVAAVNRRDLKTLDFELKYFREEVNRSKSAVDRIAVLSFLPLAGPYVTDLRNAAAASLEAYDTALAMNSYLAPLFPNITFEGWGGGRISYGSGTEVGKLAEKLPGVSQELAKYKNNFGSISARLMTINEKRYPESLRGKPVRKYIGEIRGVSSIVNNYFDDIIAAFAIAPDILGMKGSKNYLIIVQNDKEIRPGGGLLGGYAFLSMENGNFKLIRSGDVSFLDKDVIKPRPTPPDFISRFLSTSALYLKDANYDPDFKNSAQNIRDIWLSTPNPFDIGGIIVVDTKFLKTLIETLGEVKSGEGLVINAQNIDETLNGFFSFVGNQSPESRKYKDITSVLLNELLKKSFSYSTYNSNDLAQKILAMVKSKHLLFYSTDEKLQALAEKYNAAGAIRKFNGDYLQVSDAVYSQKRSNWNVNQNVTKVVKINGSNLENELKIEFEAKPETGSPADVGDTHYVRIYVPKGSKLTASDGSLEKVSESEDLEKTVFAAVVKLETNQKKNLTLNYTSPKPGFDDGRYKLLIQKQAGTGDFKYKVSLGGQSQEFNLSEDKEISFSL